MVPLGPLGVLPTFYPSAIASLGVSCRWRSVIPWHQDSSASALSGSLGVGTARHQQSGPSAHLMTPISSSTMHLSVNPSARNIWHQLSLGLRIPRRRHCQQPLASAVGTFGAPHNADRLQHDVPRCQSRRLPPTASATFGINYPSASGSLGVSNLWRWQCQQPSASAVGTLDTPHDANQLAIYGFQLPGHPQPLPSVILRHQDPSASATFGVSSVSNPRHQQPSASASLGISPFPPQHTPGNRQAMGKVEGRNAYTLRGLKKPSCLNHPSYMPPEETNERYPSHFIPDIPFDVFAISVKHLMSSRHQTSGSQPISQKVMTRFYEDGSKYIREGTNVWSIQWKL
ncbi:hypothetical protein B0H34DRAFT_674455 [Crassisporium funariophilum]|nr:hypothetical protein B0H34DRAFT_674455 [Crassisporium funariophilum]